MKIEFRTSERVAYVWTADVLTVPSQDDIVIRRDRVYRVAKVVHRIGEDDVGSRIDVIVDPLAIEPEAVLP